MSSGHVEKTAKSQRWIPLSKSISTTETSRPDLVPPSSGRASPVLQHSSHSKSLTELNAEANALVLGAFREESRTTTPKSPPRTNSLGGASFSKMSLTSIMPSFGALSRTRSYTTDDTRGRRSKTNDPSSRDSSAAPSRSISPFRRFSRPRDRSPSVEALRQSQSDWDSDVDSVGQPMRAPRNAFNEKDSPSDSEEEDNDWDDFDQETTGNTEKNAATVPLDEADLLDINDPLGEGVNIVHAPEPLFPQQPTPGTSSRRKRPVKPDVLPLVTAPPLFQRNRCTVTITQGVPLSHCVGRTPRRYMVASDLSEESKYAVEWGIGTVLKDGDEMWVVISDHVLVWLT